MTKLVQLILTHRTAGKGTEDDPLREVLQLYTCKGTLIYEEDPTKDWAMLRNAINQGEL